MTHDNVLVFFKSPDGKGGWLPVDRDELPDWIKDPAIIDRLMAGEQATNPPAGPEFYRVTVVAREPVPEPVPRLYGYLHSREVGGCGNMAFFLATKPAPGLPPPNLGDITYADGSHPRAGEMTLRCGSCGGAMWRRGQSVWRTADLVTIS